MKKRLLRVSIFGILGLVVLCIAGVGFTAMSNRGLPTRSQVTDRLSELEKARLAESVSLRRSLVGEMAGV
jgi:hypothetical protein